MTKEEMLKKVLLVPCTSKEALRRWINVYLGLDFPSCTVDPTSNSNPTDLLWEIYHSMLVGEENKTRFLYFAARDAYKTLISSVIELLAVLHFKRDVAHQASIKSQASVAIKYQKNYGTLPYIRDYATQANEHRLEFTRYTCNDGTVISPLEYDRLDPASKINYKMESNFTQIVIATVKGSNSLHTQLYCLDEADLAPRTAIEEAKLIPSQTRDGKPPIILITSSRKYAYGLVQEEIDQANDRGTIVRHWNAIDVSKPCPASRCLSDEPKVKIFFSTESLKRYSESEFDLLDKEHQDKCELKMGYRGCLENCRLFAVCQGRLVTEQKSNSSLLKNLSHVQNLFRSVDVEVAKAQLMCWKPSSFGLIYPNFDPLVHVISASQMAEKITGEKYPEYMTKKDLINLLQNRGNVFYAGMDHGYTHNFAVVTGAKDGNRMFVVDVISAPELELSQKIEVCKDRIKYLDPIVFADPEDPASNKTLKKHLRLRDWSKTAGSVIGGINIVRFKLMPTMGNEPQLYLLKGDDGCNLLAKDFSTYHWITDKTTGKPTDVPNESDDDRLDALRYLIMNVFAPKGKVLVANEEKKKQAEVEILTMQNWAQKVIDEAVNRPSDIGETINISNNKGKRGSIVWDIS